MGDNASDFAVMQNGILYCEFCSVGLDWCLYAVGVSSFHKNVFFFVEEQMRVEHNGVIFCYFVKCSFSTWFIYACSCNLLKDLGNKLVAETVKFL